MSFNKFYIISFNFFALFIVFFHLLYSCSPSNKFDKQLSKNDKIEEKSLKTKCPKDGICFINFLSNKSIKTKTVNNIFSYDIVDDSNKTVIQFQYSKNQDETPVDGGYRETIFFEVSNTNKNLELSNLDLQKTKMIYARYCNCRGKAGVFLVDKGNLKLEYVKEKFSFVLNYNIDNNPSLITQIIVNENVLN